MATQNPVDQEGTYPLPEAQVDRFMLKVVLDYPKKEEEKLIIRNNLSSAGMPKASNVLSPDVILKAREVVKEVYMDEKIEQTIDNMENDLAFLSSLKAIKSQRTKKICYWLRHILVIFLIILLSFI